MRKKIVEDIVIKKRREGMEKITQNLGNAHVHNKGTEDDGGNAPNTIPSRTPSSASYASSNNPFLEKLRASSTPPSSSSSGSGPRDPFYRETSQKVVFSEGARGTGRVLKWGIIGILAIFGATFGILSLSSGAEIFITPKTEYQNVAADIVAKKGDGGDIVFSVAVNSASKTETLASQGIKEIEKRASGKIRVFNDYSSAGQRLIARTRFETPDGKIFRITDAVTVPGRTKKSGENVPGSIEVVVFAEEAGEEYNTGFSDFTIPGLKGTPMFDGFYARSVTEMSGGFSGLVNVVDEDALEEARKRIEEELTNQLVGTEVADEIGTVTFPDGIFLSFSEKLEDETETNEPKPVNYSITGELKKITLPAEILARILIGKTYGEEANPPTMVKNLGDLNFSILDKDLISNVASEEDIALSISGRAQFSWSVPPETLKERFKGTSTSQEAFQAIFKQEYPNILKAELRNIRPFWSRSFPDNAENITVTEVFSGSE